MQKAKLGLGLPLSMSIDFYEREKLRFFEGISRDELGFEQEFEFDR